MLACCAFSSLVEWRHYCTGVIPLFAASLGLPQNRVHQVEREQLRESTGHGSLI